MSQFEETKTNKIGHCVVCGKEVPKRDVRDKDVVFCGRIHANLARFSARYRGTNSGPMDRPTAGQLLEKQKFNS